MKPDLLFCYSVLKSKQCWCSSTQFCRSHEYPILSLVETYLFPLLGLQYFSPICPWKVSCQGWQYFEDGENKNDSRFFFKKNAFSRKWKLWCVEIEFLWRPLAELDLEVLLKIKMILDIYYLAGSYISTVGRISADLREMITSPAIFFKALHGCCFAISMYWFNICRKSHSLSLSICLRKYMKCQ